MGFWERFHSDFWSILCLSLQVSGIAVLISALIGIPLGAWLGLAPRRTTFLLRVAVHTGMALPPVVVGLVLYLLLSRSGPLALFGWLFTPQAMILAQQSLFEYTEVFYNQQRLHSTLGYVSPTEYERQYEQAA